MRSGEDEARSPKYAHLERERRWLIDPQQRPALDALPYVLIEDRYIDATRLRLRRMTDSASDASVFKLTKKYEAVDPLARPIVTAYLTDTEFAVFSALPARCLSKRRYKIEENGHEFSLDQFEDVLKGLELLEIESPTDDLLGHIGAPQWAIREVSHDPRFQGGALVELDPDGLDALLVSARALAS